MCGIMGYIGKREALPILIEGLKKLEYRGYDSAGVAVLDERKRIDVFKAAGKIEKLETKLKGKRLNGHAGIAHTRWATHGKPTEANAHPHNGCDRKLWVVHNGIIENYQDLKKALIGKGHKFSSKTDTEILAHLIEEFYEGSLIEALQRALKIVKGAYGIVVMHENEPDKLITSRLGSPLVIGKGKGEMVISSDALAISPITKKVIYLKDMEIAEVKAREVKVLNRNNIEIRSNFEYLDWDAGQEDKGKFPHFMLKEIFEQPDTVKAAISGRISPQGGVKLGGIENANEKLGKIKKIIIIGCGTARYAGLVGGYLIEDLAGIPVDVEYASEFRYRNLPLDKSMAVLAVSQSGETADTLAAIKKAKKHGLLALGIVNIPGSSIPRETDAGIYTRSGPEIAVASTKAFTSQIAVLAMLALYLGLKNKNLSKAAARKICFELSVMPAKIRQILKVNREIKKIAGKYYNYKNFAFLGRTHNEPVAMEGALKLKEISYIHAEGFPSGEMKHGPIAMIGEDFPSVAIVPQDSVYEKNLSNMEEIRARGGRIIAVATEGDDNVRHVADDIIYIPRTLEMLAPILTAVPLQLLAYHIAALNGKDVDKPRNLAKSVTVE